MAVNKAGLGDDAAIERSFTVKDLASDADQVGDGVKWQGMARAVA